jgi:acetyl esterase/lipase
LRIISVDYPTAPFARWNEIQQQMISVFKALQSDGYKMNNIGVFGDSAGGVR